MTAFEQKKKKKIEKTNKVKTGKSPPKLALGKTSYVKFCKLA